MEMMGGDVGEQWTVVKFERVSEGLKGGMLNNN
jgi:hypothetical protein